MKYNLDEIGLNHISIIMDGNGRWAKSQGKARVFGHEKGAETLRKIVDYSGHINLKYLSVFAFSTENWKRPKLEVDALMSLLVKFCKKETKTLKKNNCRLLFIGDIDNMPQKQMEAIKDAEYELKDCTGLTLSIFMNYGGRMDIVDACKKIIENKIKIDDINEDLFSKYLYTSEIPDPDLIVRTSGELRLSNYLLWQSAYSEFYFTDVNWPDFNENELDKAIIEYSKRKRRFGGLNE